MYIFYRKYVCRPVHALRGVMSFIYRLMSAIYRLLPTVNVLMACHHGQQ